MNTKQVYQEAYRLFRKESRLTSQERLDTYALDQTTSQLKALRRCCGKQQLKAIQAAHTSLLERLSPSINARKSSLHHRISTRLPRYFSYKQYEKENIPWANIPMDFELFEVDGLLDQRIREFEEGKS